MNTGNERAKIVMPKDEVARLILVSQGLIKKGLQNRNIACFEDAIIIELGVLAGLSNMEIRNLKKEECLVGHGKRYIHISNSRGGRSRDVEIPNSLIRDIRGLLVFLIDIGKNEISPYLIRTERSLKMSGSGLHRRWNGYTDYTIQSARGAYGRYVFQVTVDSAFVQKQMGLSRGANVFYYQSDECNKTNRKGLKDYELSLDGIAKTPERSLPVADEQLRSFVYVVESNGIYKIGHTTNVPRRVKSIQTSCPFLVKPLVIINGGVELEKSLHTKFKSKNTYGEWFTLKQEDIETILKQNDEKIEWVATF
jgi:hypothetical protein